MSSGQPQSCGKNPFHPDHHEGDEHQGDDEGDGEGDEHHRRFLRLKFGAKLPHVQLTLQHIIMFCNNTAHNKCATNCNMFCSKYT